MRTMWLAAATGMLAAAPGSAQPAPAGGNGTIYMGTYAKKILVIDEATLEVRDSIPISIGIPAGMTLSADRKRLYVSEPGFEDVEVIDIATRRPVDRFRLSNDTMRVRLWGFTVEPRERFAVLFVKTYTKQRDRFVIGRPTLLKYDLARKVVTDTIKWPQNQEREGAQILFSPQGDLLYFFAPDGVLIYDTQTLKQVDRWELSRAIDDGMGQWNFGFPESLYEEPGYFTGLFRTTDPVNRRQLMGVARVDLVNKAVDFYSLGPSEPVGFALAPGRTRAYGLRQQVGNYQMWRFDLAGRRVEARQEFEGRPRMGLSVSTNGSQLYIHTAGATIDVYDAATLRHLRTVEYRADMTRLLVVPAER